MASNKSSNPVRATHEFPPFFERDSKILILGSFPSVKSREQKFYYGHPMNRFWKVLSQIYGKPIPITIDDKKRFLKDTYLALYDVIECCDIVGSSDASIKNVVPADILAILQQSEVKLILINGTKAGRLFEKYQLPILGSNIPYLVLPSTSPANAAVSLQQLVEEWGPAFLH